MVNFYLDSRANKNGRHAIRVSVCFNGIRVITTIGASIPAEYWNIEKQIVKKGFIQYSAINIKLSKIKECLLDYFNECIYKLTNPNKDDVQSILKSIINHNPINIGVPDNRNRPKVKAGECRFKTYLMHDSNLGYTKIGRSKNPRLREKTLQGEKPTISLFAVCDEDIEFVLHKKYKDKRVRGEWFKLSKREIKDIMLFYNFTNPNQSN